MVTLETKEGVFEYNLLNNILWYALTKCFSNSKKLVHCYVPFVKQ